LEITATIKEGDLEHGSDDDSKTTIHSIRRNDGTTLLHRIHRMITEGRKHGTTFAKDNHELENSTTNKNEKLPSLLQRENEMLKRRIHYLENDKEKSSGYEESSFREALRDRSQWLIGLLILQSCSGFILSRNEILLQRHPVIIYFLTMLVGAGGNAGNQASVRVVRSLALGTLTKQNIKPFLVREIGMAFSLSFLLSIAGFFRAIAFQTPILETIAITTALALIVFSSICLGVVLPLILHWVRVDPAHSSTTIQVIMDILGVVLTVCVSSVLLDGYFGRMLL